MGHPADGVGQRGPQFTDDMGDELGPGRHGHLLAQHRADRQFAAVGMARHPPPRRRAHKVTDDRVGAQVRGDRGRITVEVEQAPARRGRRVEVAIVLEHERRLHVAVARDDIDHPRPIRQSQAAPVAAVDQLLDARHHAASQECHRPRAVKWRACGQTEGVPRHLSSTVAGRAA
jgi:hypothetical protein